VITAYAVVIAGKRLVLVRVGWSRRCGPSWRAAGRLDGDLGVLAVDLASRLDSSKGITRVAGVAKDCSRFEKRRWRRSQVRGVWQRCGRVAVSRHKVHPVDAPPDTVLYLIGGVLDEAGRVETWEGTLALLLAHQLDRAQTEEGIAALAVALLQAMDVALHGGPLGRLALVPPE
jgi:hypothetical protein